MSRESFSKRFNYKTTPVAKKDAMVVGDKYRFTILTPRLIRIEYNESGYFEDRATQVVINRNFEVPKFTVVDEPGLLKITTDYIELKYYKKPFSINSLTVKYMQAGLKNTDWYFDEEGRDNLKGTRRTLDGVDGECELEKGLMSRGGKITVIDDSKSVIIEDDGFVSPRKGEFVDRYLFCYGCPEPKCFDFEACLKDFYKLTGKTPLIPRYVLGNWWSRFHAYTQDEYVGLMKKFKEEDIPFSVAVIDMDWHYVNIDQKYGSGWTGYTWNKNLFPDHKGFLEFLHNEGMRVTLNLHPQEGVAAHEDCYEEMAEAMGVDPKSEKKVDFDITDPKFIENYFDIVHHPLEDEGVDFWWMDWQQGNISTIPGLNPLWMLNHYHYIDNARDNKRPLMFSRYSGPGSHRYPIGFSGDTVVTWDSLKFQPYFTLTATNIGYGWWSHDIGGHMFGVRDDELITRWMEFGVFSPINRLHSCENPFMGKEPWKYNKICEIAMKKFLKLRHEMIPYLYTMNYLSHVEDTPLVRPLYYKWNDPDCYNIKTQYIFGNQMIVSPIVSPSDKKTAMGSAKVYLPKGKWFDFFTNKCYVGGRTVTMFRDMYSIPVLVREGGIVPLAKLNHINDVENPDDMRVKVYAGASNSFSLYEDDGVSFDYKDGKCAFTDMTLCWGDNTSFVISKPRGDLSVIPSNRSYEIEFIGFYNFGDICILSDGKEIPYEKEINDGVLTVKVKNVSGEIKVLFNKKVSVLKNDIDSWLYDFIEKSQIENETKSAIYYDILKEESQNMKQSRLFEMDIDENVKKAVAEIITSDTI